MLSEDPSLLRRQVRVVTSWLWLVVVATAACAGIAFAVASQTPVSYSSTVSIFVGPPLGGSISGADLDVGLALRQTYADLATTRPVLARVIQATGVPTTVDDLTASVTARVPANSSLLLISVTYHDGPEAAVIANAIATDLATYPPSTKTSKSPPNIALTIVDPAVAPAVPDSRRIALTVGLGAGIGLILAIGIAFLVESLRSAPGGTGNS